jgi:hypothetical protein
MIPRDRTAFSAIVDRPPLKLPEGDDPGAGTGPAVTIPAVASAPRR